MKLLVTLCFCLSLIVIPMGSLVAQESITKKATWSPPNEESVLAAFEAWFQKGNVDGKSAGLIRDYLQSVDWKSGDLVDQVIPGIEMGSQDVSSFVEMLAEAKAGQKVQTSHLLDNGSADDFVTGHVRLLYGRWLARNELFDESLEELEKLDVDQVLAPATLLYYRGLMEHQLLKPKACIKTLSRLLENSDHLPRRYNVLAKLMLADMKRMEKDSLDEISRMMGDIRRRTDLNRSGTRVRGKEEDVVNKLDKLIERLEEQRQQMQMAAQGSNQSSSPADREQRMAGQGTGDVKSKRQIDGGQWGNLDPAQRDAALADMSKDLPPHYRAVIEEYFRKLADQTEKRE